MRVNAKYECPKSPSMGILWGGMESTTDYFVKYTVLGPRQDMRYYGIFKVTVHMT